MKRLILTSLLSIFLSDVAVSQSVGISATAITPNPYSILEVESKTSGVLLPRLNAGERATLTASGISITEQGLTIYNTDTDHYNYWDGYAWVEISTGSLSGSFIENQNTYQQIADFNIDGDGITRKLGVGTGMAPLGAQSHFHDGDPTGGNTMMLVDDNAGNPLMSVIDYGHIGFGTAAPNNNAAIDVTGQQGVLLPRMTTTAKSFYGTTIGVPEEGMIVYDLTQQQYNWWDGTNWVSMGTTPGSFIDNQNAVLQPADYRIAGLGVASQMGVGTGMGAILGSHHVHDANIGAGDQLLYVDDYVGLPIMTVLDEGRVGIGTSIPNPHSILDVMDTLRGVLLPRMSSTQKATLGSAMGPGEEGMMVYDLTLQTYDFWDGTAWSSAGSAGMHIDNQNTGAQPANYWINGNGEADQIGVGTNGTGFGASLHVHDDGGFAGDKLLLVDDFLGNEILNVIDAGHVTIGAAIPAAHSILDVQSTTKGVLFPRMSPTQMTALGTGLGPTDNGMTVYNSLDNRYEVWDGYVWIPILSGLPGDFIINQNTAVQPADYNLGGTAVSNKLGVGTGLGPVTGLAHIKDNSPTAGSRLLKVDDFIGNPLVTVVDGGQVGLGTSAPTASAILDMTSANKGFLPPRMTATQRAAIVGPVQGLIVYQTNSPGEGLWYYDGFIWNYIGGMSAAPIFLEDADADTKVEVEQSPDDDIIHFTNQGVEYFDFDAGRFNINNTGESVFIGEGAGANDDLSSNRNIEIGHEAGNANTTGAYNTDIGYQAGAARTTGNLNTHIGYKSGNQNTGDYNTTVGAQSFELNTTGSHNTGMGERALASNTIGDGNTALGEKALASNDDGSSNVAIGRQSMDGNTSGSNNVAVGMRSSYSNDDGAENSAIGHHALYTNQSGSYNTAIGTRSLYTSTASWNTAVGWESLRDNTTGEYNVAMGESTLSTNTTGENNTAMGYEALANADADQNTAFGARALTSNTSGSENSAIGHNALYNNSTADQNTAVGHGAMYTNLIGWDNTAIGHDALSGNTSGYSNSVVGKNALSANIDGYANTAVGRDAMLANTSGYLNTAVGVNALYNHTTGYGNTSVGLNSMYLTTGSENTALGWGAGYMISSGTNNTSVGAGANVVGTASNSSALGSGAYITASNTIQLGDAAITSIGGYAAWTNLSDGRCKQNIETDVPGLEFINRLNPVTYNMDLEALAQIKGTPDSLRSIKEEQAKEKLVYTGLIAQDVEKAAQEIDYDFSGVDAPQNENDHYGLRYAEFVAPLIQAVKELHEMNRDLKMEVEVLRKQVANVQTTASK